MKKEKQTNSDSHIDNSTSGHPRHIYGLNLTFQFFCLCRWSKSAINRCWSSKIKYFKPSKNRSWWINLSVNDTQSMEYELRRLISNRQGTWKNGVSKIITAWVIRLKDKNTVISFLFCRQFNTSFADLLLGKNLPNGTEHIQLVRNGLLRREGYILVVPVKSVWLS